MKNGSKAKNAEHVSTLTAPLLIDPESEQWKTLMKNLKEQCFVVVIQNQKIISILLSFEHGFNVSLSLWVGDVENFMYEVDEEYVFSNELEGATKMQRQSIKKKE